jgi:hypothetical protein
MILFVFNFLSNYFIYSEFIRIHPNVFLIYLKLCSPADCFALLHRRIAAHCCAHYCRTLSHTTAHTAALLDTAVRLAAHCCALH